MRVVLSDIDIERLLAEPKALPADWEQKLALRQKRGHKEAHLDLVGQDGSEFRLILRQSDENIFDFSAIIGYRPKGSHQLIRLCRCNGKHQHTNVIERESFYEFHVHIATERYQELGAAEEGYAQPCSDYSDLQGAIAALCQRCGITVPQKEQLSLEESDGWQ